MNTLNGEGRNYPFKDALPEETVSRIKSLLKERDISTKDEMWIDNANFLFSLSLRLSGFHYRVTGKAVSKPLSLASAYGELMERLQNHLLWPYVEFSPDAVGKYDFKIDPYEKVYANKQIPDLPKDFKEAKIYSENAYELWKVLKQELREKAFPVLFIPFYSMRDRQVVHLPRTFMVNLIGSNGMAAGNTPEEALTQGFSEILERYVLKLLYFDELTPPSIPESFLKTHAPAQFEMIRKLEATGLYKIIVKDCSLGKRLPVIATIIKLNDRDKYVVNIGAYPIWQISLERCLTEAFQGQNIFRYQKAVPLNLSPPFNQKMTFDNHMNIVRRGKGQYPPSIFDDVPDFEFKEDLDLSFQNQKEMMLYLIKLIRELGHNIYVRDVSYLKFNAYFIIVPGMSVSKMLSKRKWKEMVTMIPVLQYLRNFDKLSKEELFDLAEDMENFMADESRHRYFPFSHYVGQPVENFLPWEKVTLQLVLSLLYCKLGIIERAHKYMLGHIELLNEKDDETSLQPYAISRDFLSLSRTYPESPEKVEKILRQVYDEATLKKQLNIFKKSADVPKMIKGFIPEFELPNCWDCGQCHVENLCNIRNLEKIYLSVKESIKENPIDQMCVQKILSM